VGYAGTPFSEETVVRLARFCAVISFLLPAPALAQASMPMTGGSASRPMMGAAMPDRVQDDRQIVPLTAAERSVVAAEMRQMLASIQGIADGLARDDLHTVTEAAAKSGAVMMQNLPAQIRMKFPAPFAQMGMATHKDFDQIARDTKTLEDPAPVLRRLSAAMQNCIACHATYRFAPTR
jgi:cytochrome c556